MVLGGVVSYANSVKENVLKVLRNDLETVGAVSSQVAAQMAEGSRDLLCSDLAVSVTGIAGPGGGSDDKPVGTVWFGISTAEGTRTVVTNRGELALPYGQGRPLPRSNSYVERYWGFLLRA